RMRPRQILARAAAQPLQADTLAVVLEGEEVALRRIGLEIVERRDGARAVAEGGMAGDVVDPLGADIDHAAVAHAFELFAAGREHSRSPYVALRRNAGRQSSQRFDPFRVTCGFCLSL